MEAKEVQTVPQREDVGFAVELEASGREVFLNAGPGLLENDLVLVDEVEIVHVPAVIPYPQDLFDEMV